jgi:hypothetical protein
MSLGAKRVLVLRWLGELVNHGNVAVEPELVAKDVRLCVHDTNRRMLVSDRVNWPR